MNNLFVPSDIAMILQDKGYKEDCIAEYDLDDLSLVLIESLETPSVNSNNVLTAPLYQQVVDWLREKHGVMIYLDLPLNTRGKNYNPSKSHFQFKLARCLDGVVMNGSMHSFSDQHFDSYYEGLADMIKFALERID